MLQLANSTPFEAALAVLADETGVDTLFVAVKATFSLDSDGGPEIADEPVPVRMEDEYRGEPGLSSLAYAAEMHLSKPSTDVVLVGRAWTVDAPRRDVVDVTLTVAERSKTVRVFGDRVWKTGLLAISATAPEPFESLPLVYERAYGGVHRPEGEDGPLYAEEHNPAGVGFRGKRSAREVAGTALPNLEDPHRPLGGPGQRVPPQGFGFVAPGWLPRRAHAGTYDDAWLTTRSPYLPADFDPRFFNAASEGLVFDRHLEGGEPVELLHGSARGPLRFRLPDCRPEIAVRLAGAVERPRPRLETVLLEPEEERLCLTWRAALPCDKRALQVETVAVGLARGTEAAVR